jgi:predicted ABC-type ATPase
LPFLKPVLFLLADPNGAGKSTLYRSAVASGLIPAGAEFVNADLHEAHALQHITDPELRSAQARSWAKKVQPAKPPTPSLSKSWQSAGSA